MDPKNGYSESISLTGTVNSVAGINITFDPSILEPSQTIESTATIIVASTVSKGNYEITITGSGNDGKVHSCNFQLTVQSENPQPTIQIISPNNGDGVDISINVQGTSQNIPTGQVIWVIVHQGSLYYPMPNPAIIQNNGEWSSATIIGGKSDTGKQFDIYVVLANQTAQDQFNTYNTNSKIQGIYPGTDKLPVGAVSYCEITVIRNPPPTEISISYPTNGSTVSKLITVQGTSQSIPTSQAIWAIVYIPKISLYYPMPAAAVVDQTGAWTTPVTLGGQNDTGLEYDIIMVLANQAGQDALKAYNTNSELTSPGNYPGLGQYPAGLTEYSRVVVIRGP